MEGLALLENAEREISAAETQDKVVAAVSAHMDDFIGLKKFMLKNRINRGIAVVDLADDFDRLRRRLPSIQSERQAMAYKEEFLTWIKQVHKLIANTPAQDLAALVATEKYPLSKLPKDVADKVAEYLSGKKGPMERQLKEIKTEHGKGGRKTKKKRSSKRKTYGRRV